MKLGTSTSVSTATTISAVNDNPLFIPSVTDYLDSDDEPLTTDMVQIVDWSESERSEYDGLPHTSDDPIVREYDVIMTSELAKNLYLFQYPVRSRHKPYTKAENSCPVNARLKRKAGLVEVDVPVNVAFNFDQEKGRTWGEVLMTSQEVKDSGLTGKAINTRGTKRRKIKGEGEEKEDNDKVVDFTEAVRTGRVLSKQTLGSKIQADEAKYMIGVFKEDRLHLTPLNATLQLRPLFHHVDAQLAAERAQTKSLRDAEEPEKSTQARAVHLTVNQEVSQMSGTMKALRIAEEDEWKRLHWIDQDDDEAWDHYELLCLEDFKVVGSLKCSTSKSEYIDWLSGAMMVKREGWK